MGAPVLAFVGPVDHGKSTLIGRLLLEGGALPRPERERLRRLEREVGLAAALVHLLDSLQEEREGLFTLDTTRRVLGPRGGGMTLIDTPGHVELLSNMLSGATASQAAVLVLDASQEFSEPGERFARILAFLGLNRLGVALTKADLVPDRATMEAQKVRVRELLAPHGLTPRWVLPVSAVSGLNVRRGVAGEKPLLAALRDLCPPPLRGEAPFRLLVQGTGPGAGAMASGRVVSGRCRAGDRLLVHPSGGSVRVARLAGFPEAPREVADGDFASLVLEGATAARGDVLSSPTPEPRVLETVRCGVLWLDAALPAGNVTLHCGFQTRAAELLCVVPRGSGPPPLWDMDIRLERPAVFDPDVPSLSRVVLTREGEVVGMGLVRADAD